MQVKERENLRRPKHTERERETERKTKKSEKGKKKVSVVKCKHPIFEDVTMEERFSIAH